VNFLCFCYRTTEEFNLNRLIPKSLKPFTWACAASLLLFPGLNLLAQEAGEPEAITEAVAGAAAESSPEAPPAKPPSMSNKWRMEVSGNAESDGAVVVKISPQDGEPFTAEVAIKNKTSENGVAKALVKGLKAQLPQKQFHIERDDGEDVLVKKKMGAKNFGLQLVSSDVKHVRFRIEKE
jgi:hypothetical protein